MQARGWSVGFEMFRVRREWSDVFGNGVHRFGNAVDGSGRPRMGSCLVRECSGGVWTVSRHE